MNRGRQPSIRSARSDRPARSGGGGRSGRRRSRARSGPWWIDLSDQDLLDVKLCDLGLTIEGTALEGRMDRLDAELDQHGLSFRPYAWLSSDWFTPQGLTGFAIPFYLAHPRLARLERRQLHEVEGGSHRWCLRILRHETGHAIDNAYRLHRDKRWREHFGRLSEPYRSTYVPNPFSRRYVFNLQNWYAQSHPMEDFAETFAVWLHPRSRWRTRYRGWPALKKLEFVDELMKEIRGRPPFVKTRERTDSLPQLNRTLRKHYQVKRALYAEQDRSTLDAELRRLFVEGSDFRRSGAAAFLRYRRRDLLERVANGTGQVEYVVDQVLNEMIARCSELGLRLRRSERETHLDVLVLLSVQTMNFMYRGRQEFRR